MGDAAGRRRLNGAAPRDYAASFAGPATEAPVDHPADQAQRSAAATPEDLARLLAEAAAVTTHDAGAQVEVQLGHFCNNRCVFCASGQLTAEGRAQPVPEAEVFAALDAAAERGLQRVTFLGGEPTIQDCFLPALEHAASLGFSEITVFTNGARLGDARFLERVLAKTPVTWRISIQGGNAAAHDAATGQPGAFARIVKGLDSLSGLGQAPTANMCLTTGSLSSLADLPDLLLRHGVRQMCVDMVRPVSAGPRSEAWMRSILPRFSDVAGHVRALLADLDQRAPGYDINITHLPFCVLPEAAHRISHGGVQTVTFTADLDQSQGVMDKYAFQARDRVLLPTCEACAFRVLCTGVPQQYLDLHGGDELVPVRLEDLARVDPQQNSLAVQLDDLLALIAKAPDPGPWWFERIHRDVRQRGIELILRHRQGGLARLWLLRAAPPIDVGLLELAATTRYRLALDLDTDVPARDLATLALACLTALRQEEGATWHAWQTAGGVLQAAQRFADHRRWLSQALWAFEVPGARWQLMRVRSVRAGSQLDFADGAKTATIDLIVSGAAQTAPIASRVVSSEGLEAADLQRLSQHIGATLRASRASRDRSCS